ncbi:MULTISPECIES: hypothetical protein [unclassified Dermacoccus]|uniref:hypothetical protein n=1 Tax=unclassified Dermacoccus TaxID=2643059 RepID=UPI000AC0104D|nr:MULTISPECIES: hypothetical protein [unclassified Dermacoccus]MBZ4498952.1 hypothetical protein [Dermacoccus sp. Tok2021]
MKSLRVVTAGLALTTVLAGCGTFGAEGTSTSSSSSQSSSSTSESSPSESSSSESSATESYTSSESSSSSSSPTSSSSASSSDAGNAALPAGTKLVTAPDAGMSFGVPSGWQKVEASLLDNPRSKNNIEPLAKKSGLTPEQMVKQFETQADIVVIDLSGTSNFADNANVTKVAIPVKPTKGQLDSSFDQIGGKPVSFREIETPLGQGVQYEYSLPVAETTVRGVALYVPDGKGSYRNITVSSGTAERAQKLAKDIVSSLRES